MRIKDEYIITELGDETILIPTEQATESFRGIVRLNETAAFIVTQLQKDTTIQKIADALFAEYEVERSDAEKHVNAVLDKLRELDAIQE